MPINTSFNLNLAPSVGYVTASSFAQDKQNDVNASFSFGSLLKAQLEQVNAAQHRAEKMATDFAFDDQSVDIPQLMVAEQNALLSFNALVETRNKLVRAYQEIMQMQI